jgi:hypothetical protein
MSFFRPGADVQRSENETSRAERKRGTLWVERVRNRRSQAFVTRNLSAEQVQTLANCHFCGPRLPLSARV